MRVQNPYICPVCGKQNIPEQANLRDIGLVHVFRCPSGHGRALVQIKDSKNVRWIMD